MRLKLRFSAVLIEEEKGYSALCPELGVASQGDSVEEALRNLEEAVKLYLEVARELKLEEPSRYGRRLLGEIEVEL